MAVTSVVNYDSKRELLFPVSGVGANIPVGTVMIPGATLGTNNGVLIPCTATSNLHGVGLLNEAHVYGNSGDALMTALIPWYPLAGFKGGSTLLGAVQNSQAQYWPSHPVDLFDTAVLVKMSYNLASTMAVASYATTSITITNEITGKDSGFDYINAGTGIGQLAFITVSNSGSDTILVAPTVALDNTSKLTQILPLFYQLPVWKINSTTQPTTIDSTAAVGTGRASIMANFIQKNGDSFYLDPYTFSNAQGLNLLAQLDFYSFLAMQSTAFHPVS